MRSAGPMIVAILVTAFITHAYTRVKVNDEYADLHRKECPHLILEK